MTEQQAAMRQALAFVCWNCFGECRTEGWDGPPPTAAKTETALRAALAADDEPVAWKHDCAALLQNDVELWVDRCPHCGKPRPPNKEKRND